MKKILIISCMVLVSFSAIAATTLLETATQRADNTALGLSEIKGHKMYCGTVAGDMTGSYSFERWYPGAALPNTEIIMTDVPVGTYYCHFTTMDIDDRESIISAKYKTLINEAKAVPKPPLVTPEIIKIVTTL